jgi:hypothetical protein
MKLRRVSILMALLAASAMATGCATTTRFNSSPEGAAVYLDGERIGTTPVVHYDRGSLPQRHRIQLELEGYETEEFYIDRELALVYSLLVVPATFGVGALWGWWMPDRYMFTLREVGAGLERLDVPSIPDVPADPAPPAEPPPPPAEPDPTPADPAPPEAPPEPPAGEDVGEEEDEDDLDDLPPPPPPPAG